MSIEKMTVDARSGQTQERLAEFRRQCTQEEIDELERRAVADDAAGRPRAAESARKLAATLRAAIAGGVA